MKISRSVLILLSVVPALTLVFSEQGTSTPTKAQQILRQKIDELNSPGTGQSEDKLLADAERLYKEGKISKEQLADLKKKISEQRMASGGPLSPEAQAKAQKLLQQRIAELDSGQKAVTQPVNPEAQAKAEQALQQKLNELRTAIPAHPGTGAVPEDVLHQKMAELNAAPKTAAPPSTPRPQMKPEQKAAAPASTSPAQAKAKPARRPKPVESPGIAAVQPQTSSLAEVRTQEKTNLVPSSATATLTPEREAPARELLRMKIAEAHKNVLLQPEPDPEAQSRAVADLQRREAELKAGVTANATEQTRLLRLKIAESKGIISPEESAKVAAAPAALRATPAIGASPLTFQTSNKTGLARLNELTELYKADKITPYEYHHERAKIVTSL